MIPVKIAYIRPTLKNRPALSHTPPGLLISEVDSLTGDPADPAFVKLISLTETCGFTYQPNRHLYQSLGWLFCQGSIPWHTDLGLSYIVAWVARLGSEHSELITRHGDLPVKEGDVFAFNADHGHAWLTNNEDPVVFAQITVGRRRKVPYLTRNPLSP
jgi:hypothetical protein